LSSRAERPQGISDPLLFGVPNERGRDEKGETAPGFVASIS
jgi:hypothetical protein